ncbi:MAG: flagellar basal body rod protein FlgC [Pseudobdellovibrionaceae bacterium]|jgi:flagellar basal-body rod protein FlgC|nr:flagellar basal body rod protein FlgC [Pseudobdellovibrionaceae bacterium]
MSDIINTMKISGAGMRVQSERVRVIAQNMANSDTAPSKPGELPYTRKTITFKNQMDREIGEKLVQVDKIEQDKEADYVKKYMPGHPAADADGYVMMPNVSSLIEMMDMREASKSYEANLNMYTQTRDMAAKTIDILR